MEIYDFIRNTVNHLDDKYYQCLKGRLEGKYITFSFIPQEEISKDVFCEKLADYFERVEIRTNESFAKLLTRYFSDLDEVVKRYIPKKPSAKKGEPVPPMPRSLKYYKHALEIKASKDLKIEKIEDYSRIMLSLYMGAIHSNLKEVNHFDFSTEKLDIDKILNSLKLEKPGNAIPLGKKNMFQLGDLYSSDTLTIVLVIIMYFYIKNREIKGE